MLCCRDERLPLNSTGLIRIEVRTTTITYQVGSQLILTRTSHIVKRVNLAGNLKSFCLLLPHPRCVRIVNDFAARLPATPDILLQNFRRL
jgi:hypothetical protein